MIGWLPYSQAFEYRGRREGFAADRREELKSILGKDGAVTHHG